MSQRSPRPDGVRYDPGRLSLTHGRIDRGSAAYRPQALRLVQPQKPAVDDPNPPPGAASGPNPYVDYARRYTADGGVELVYKSNDTSIWRICFCLFAWTLLMAGTTWLMREVFAAASGCADPTFCAFTATQVGGGTVVFLLVGGSLAWLLFQPVHEMHSIEIRSDCLILDESDVFWTAQMEARPKLSLDDSGAYVLRGIYGTRHMEFVKLKPVDKNDATPAVLAGHLENALQQLWDRAQVWAGD